MLGLDCPRVQVLLPARFPRDQRTDAVQVGLEPPLYEPDEAVSAIHLVGDLDVRIVRLLFPVAWGCADLLIAVEDLGVVELSVPAAIEPKLVPTDATTQVECRIAA